MNKEILSEDQIRLLPLVRKFKREFYLAGGTAIALYLGHRRSIDFDLFRSSPLRHQKIISEITSHGSPYYITRRVSEQMNLIINNVTFTFFEYPFNIEANTDFDGLIKLPSLIDLAAMKAYALGRRSKWKDYVDLYFLLKDEFTIDQISERASGIFGQLFSSKLFRAQICYFDDINYSEPVEFLLPEPSGEEIRQFLIDKAIDISL